MASVEGTVPINCAEVYRSWKLARDALARSIDNYLSASSALASASIEAVTHSQALWDGLLPEAPYRVDLELSGLVDEEERLREARLMLLASRNCSKGSSKINTLPTEVLVLIFIAANPYPTEVSLNPGASYPMALSSVCQLWRQITLGIPSLWSFLHLYVDGPHPQKSYLSSQLWAERSGRALICAKIVEQHYDGGSVQTFDDFRYHLDLYMPRIYSLNLDASGYFNQATLQHMVEFSVPGSLNALALVSRPRSADLQMDIHVNVDFDHLLSSFSESALDAAEEFLSSIQYLSLSHDVFPWYSSAYRNLIELDLDLLTDGRDFSNCLPTQSEIAAILSSSPMLQSLSLRLDFIWAPDDSSQPVHLNQLRRFTLESSTPDGCVGLLPLLEPGTNLLQVHVSIHSNPVFLKELRSFFRRSSINTLHIKAIDPDSWLKHISRHLPRLESLTLEHCNFHKSTLDRFVDLGAGIDNSLWPRLHTLRIMDSCIEEEVIEQIISMLRLRLVRLGRGCSITDKWIWHVDGAGECSDLLYMRY